VSALRRAKADASGLFQTSTVLISSGVPTWYYRSGGGDSDGPADAAAEIDQRREFRDHPDRRRRGRERVAKTMGRNPECAEGSG